MISTTNSVQDNRFIVWTGATNHSVWTPTTSTSAIIMPPLWMSGTSSTTTSIITTGMSGARIVDSGTGNITVYTSSTANVVYQAFTSSDHGLVWTPHNHEAHRRRYERDRRASISKARSAIKKALKLIDNMGFGDEIRVFIGGDEIVIDNPDSIFKFVLKRGASLIERTINPGFSTPYSLELLTKDDVHVTNLCVYMKNTPVFDQILAVALYIKTGNEEDVLEKANWFNRTNDPGVRRLVHDYNPRLSAKLGYAIN